tara:strand:+ start:501 stop:1121 length:621 start_codon:yes stop_codon:yes gene_type:complete
MSIGKINIHRNIEINNELHTFALQSFNEADIPKFKLYWDAWLILRNISADAGNRAPNLAEYFTEGLVALMTGSARRVSQAYAKANDSSVRFTPKGKKHGDNLQLDPLITSEVKSSTIQSDCTQLSPGVHKLDLYYFIHFYNNGNLDGTFDIYQFSPDLLKSIIVCEGKNETIQDQIDQGRRPRFSFLTEILTPNNISPIYSKVKLW